MNQSLNQSKLDRVDPMTPAELAEAEMYKAAREGRLTDMGRLKVTDPYVEAYDNLIRHKYIEVDFCACEGCKKIRIAEKAEEDHRIFMKCLRGIRKMTQETSLLASTLVRPTMELRN